MKTYKGSVVNLGRAIIEAARLVNYLGDQFFDTIHSDKALMQYFGCTYGNTQSIAPKRLAWDGEKFEEIVHFSQAGRNGILVHISMAVPDKGVSKSGILWIDLCLWEGGVESPKLLASVSNRRDILFGEYILPEWFKALCEIQVENAILWNDDNV